MSLSPKKAHVAVSILGVKGHIARTGFVRPDLTLRTSKWFNEIDETGATVSPVVQYRSWTLGPGLGGKMTLFRNLLCVELIVIAGKMDMHLYHTFSHPVFQSPASWNRLQE